MNSLTIVLTLMGTGVGLTAGFILGHWQGRKTESVLRENRWQAPKVTSEVYFGRDDEDDHPGDIERQGSHLVAAPNGVAHRSGRDFDHRYDGMDDQRVLD